MVKIQQLTKKEHSDIQSLELSSTHTDKIRKIEGLSRFKNLRSLSLSNNMIIKIQNISALTQLRILKLDFNQITTIEDIKQLTLLEELSVSYNRIAAIPSEIKFNQRLKVFHIAYNDIKSIEDIKHLGNLSNLSILSLAGNPFLSALNYVAFIKMLIPSLLILDSRDANQSIVNTNVYPHQQIFILRDALNKLIDERNSMLQHNLSQQASPIKQRDAPQAQQQFSNSMQHKHSFGKTVSFNQNERERLLQIFYEWIQANKAKIEVKKLEIGEISEAFSKRINSTSKSEMEDRYQFLLQKVKNYHQSQRRGRLSSQKKYKLQKMEEQVKAVQILEHQKRDQSRKMLQAIRAKESQYSKLKQKSNILKSLQTKILQNVSQESHKILLSQILFGQQAFQISYKDIKKYLFYPKGIIQIIKMLNQIVFGEVADYERIQKLKQFLENRSLIQIINNLKEMGLTYKKQIRKMQKQKAKIVQKLQTQALQLCDEWKQIQKQKRYLKKSRQRQDSLNCKAQPQDKFQSLELQERERILQLKKEKEYYQGKVDQLKNSTQSLQIEFQRKYKELEEFQKFFEEFKSDKEIAEGFKQELQETQQQIQNKQQILMQVDQNVKELTLKQQNLQERAAHYERKAFQKSQETAHYQQKVKSLNDKLKKLSQQINSKSYQFIRIQQQFSKLLQENKEYQKKIQRHKATFQLYEDKLKNLNEIQTSKKNTLASIQGEIQLQKINLNGLKEKVEQSQQKLNRNMQLSYQYQLKIQESKKSIQSLADINRTLSDMMQRQNQLKRTNMQLQLQNQHLFQIKGKLIEQIKVEYDDQDENL